MAIDIGQTPNFDPRMQRQTFGRPSVTFPPPNPAIAQQGGQQLPPGAQTLGAQTGQIEPNFQQMQFQQNVPQTGLIGAEQALQGGLQGALGAQQQGTNQALNTLLFGNQLAGQQLGQGQQALTAGGQAAQGQLQQGVNTLGAGGQAAQSQIQQGINALGGNFNAQAVNVDPNTGQPLFQQAAQGVGAFSPAGLQAQNLQSALSGAQGQAAFDQALINNPQQALLNRRGQEALANQAAASGGLGSGQFQTELQQLGQAQAGQQLQNQIANLAGLSQQGLQAAGQQGQFLSQAGQQQGNLASQNAQLGTNVNLQNAGRQLQAAGQQANLFGQGAGLSQQAAGQQAQLFGQGAGLQQQLGGQQAQLFGQGAGLSAGLAGQGAGFQQQGGINQANLLSGTAGQVAQGRTQAGRDIAGQVGASSSALANLANQQGTGLSDILGQGSANQANLLSNFGQLSAQQQQQLMSQLANLSIGQGTQLASGAGQIGQAQAGGLLGSAGAQQDTALQLATLLSDERLKDNIVKVGVKNGHNIYTWVWNNLMPIKSEIGKSSKGVIAQEVEKIKPEAISKHESGYKQVNYALIGVI